jgi:hypothetical protein
MREIAVSIAFLLAILVGIATPIRVQGQDLPPVVGRWDITVASPEGTYPSWLEVEPSGARALVGRFVGRWGSSRPISAVGFEGTTIKFSIPAQWEQGGKDLYFEGQYEGGSLKGWTTDAAGAKNTWTAVRAPELSPPPAPKWGEPIVLFNGADLTGWVARDGQPSKWVVRDKAMINTASGADLLTSARFRDFKLHIEFRYPPRGNSGIYLRGRHEVQISDSDSRGVKKYSLGGIYGFLSPNAIPPSRPGEWHTFDITLLGRRVTVVLNGATLICDQEIPGITGGALDSAEGAAGPILLQGDHGPIDFRNIVLTPTAP